MKFPAGCPSQRLSIIGMHPAGQLVGSLTNADRHLLFTLPSLTGFIFAILQGMSNKVAFFDVDGTVFRSSLLIELVEALIAAKTFPTEAVDVYDDQERNWRNRQGTYQDYIMAVVACYKEYIKGVHYGEVADIGRQVVATHTNIVYRYTRDLLKELKEKDYYIVAISHSPKAILDEFCRSHGFDKVYGRIYEIGPTDRFTGVVTDEHLIQNKANIVHRVLESCNDEFETTLAVGDTESDIPMLEAVAEPICFNPNQALFDHAKRVGWKTMVERKDVIYTIPTGD